MKLHGNKFEILAELAHDRIFEDYPTIALKVRYKVFMSTENHIKVFTKVDDRSEVYLEIFTDGSSPIGFAHTVAKAFKGTREAIQTYQLQLN